MMETRQWKQRKVRLVPTLQIITLQPAASDDDIAQSVATGLRIYEAQRAAIEGQIRMFRQGATSQTPPVQIREPDAPTSHKQRQYMEYLLKELSWDNGRLIAFAAEHQFNLLTLTKREASELIDQLKGELAGEAETSTPAVESSVETEATATTEPVAEQPAPVQERPVPSIGTGLLSARFARLNAWRRNVASIWKVSCVPALGIAACLTYRWMKLANCSASGKLPRQIRPRQTAPSRHAGDMQY